ncbi:lactate utilization protein B [Capilliphycus salinus ALCB114379]|uniref:lactate utilization protein B n=1 Tax=Capilliphycus salinus TaxID=2768948 RepID=UPI0039A4123F
MTKPVNQAAAAEQFLQDQKRAQQYDKILWNARLKRDIGAASVPEWEELREIASQIKEHTLTHLADYLEQFEANAKQNGIQVHWAKDGAEHNQIVHNILGSHNVKFLIKSKSMLQEECGMVPFLESQGISITESDFGERIQQLDREPPSHIVMPAIHKTRQDVAKLFAEKIDTDPNNDDPHYLNEMMRQNTRPRFLKADAGMTGVNFAIAETGSFVVCTNEGNADIGANVPPLHIASMGIEKLIPKVEHLGVFIRLLSRSALGSPITQYTSHFTKPKPGGEIHLVIVDNGRSERLGMADFWSSLKCIRCGACLNTCPVYRRSGGLSYGAVYSGPIGMVLDPTFDAKKYSNLPYSSTLCGSCGDVCPVKIDLPEQIYKWRRVMAEKHLLSLPRRESMKAAGMVLGNPLLYRFAENVVIQKVMKYFPFLFSSKILNPWVRHRALPTVPKQTFKQWYIENRQK